MARWAARSQSPAGAVRTPRSGTPSSSATLDHHRRAHEYGTKPTVVHRTPVHARIPKSPSLGRVSPRHPCRRLQAMTAILARCSTSKDVERRSAARPRCVHRPPWTPAGLWRRPVPGKQLEHLAGLGRVAGRPGVPAPGRPPDDPPEARRRVAVPVQGRPVALASLDPVTAAVRRTPGAAPGHRIRSRRIIGGKTYRADWIPAPRADGSGWVAAGRHTETARWTLVAAPAHPPVCFAGAQIHRLDAGYRLGSDRGSPNDGRTLFSKRVMAQIRSPVRVRT